MHLHKEAHHANYNGGKESKSVGEGARQAISNSSGFFISQSQPGQTAQPASLGNSQG